MFLDKFDTFLPKKLSETEFARFKTQFYKRIAWKAHNFYGGKLQILPKVPIPDFESLNVWYTPGVSAISTAIRDTHETSYQLTFRKNLVAVVSDGTRVLGDGDCTPAGAMGVMEGKALLMKFLGGIDAIPLCINSRDDSGEPSAEKIIQFVKMIQPSFGAINLEDISQPNCFKVLDILQKECEIPVWHDDAQGTACVVLAGLLNALKIVNKPIETCKFVLFGSGAGNTGVANLLILFGANPHKIILMDSKGSLHIQRKDYQQNPDFYRQWDLCKKTNAQQLISHEEIFTDADVLIALSQPGPDIIKKEWIQMMASDAIVFACANPNPEIFPSEAMEAGAAIVATGRGDFPNQINNSICFPGMLKGTLACGAKQISDSMMCRAAQSIADFVPDNKLSAHKIIPDMFTQGLYSKIATDIAMQAIEDGNIRFNKDLIEIKNEIEFDIQQAQLVLKLLEDNSFIQQIPEKMILETINECLKNF